MGVERTGCSDGVAVIMSTYAEKPEWLEASMESILNQTFGGFRFYIALDDPENRELNALVYEYAKRDARIEVVPNERNLGLAETLNKLIAVSREPVLARMDADDVARSERLAKELQHLHEQHLDLVMCGADVISQGEVVPGRRLPDLSPEVMYEVQKHTNVSFHSSWLVKREVYEMLGGYRDVHRCEDYDLVLRALQAGFRLGRMAEMLMEYRLADEGLSSSNWMEQEVNAAYLRDRFCEGEELSAIRPEDVNALTREASSLCVQEYASAKASYDELFASVEVRKPFHAMKVALKGATNPVFRKKMRAVLAERRAVARICRDLS